jgi:ABC-type uncharacterized transport system fused permease/ATPase subunit
VSAADLTITATHGEATAAHRLHSDLWAELAESWAADAATRAHFRNIAEIVRGPQRTSGNRGLATGSWLLDAQERLPVIWGTEAAPLAIEGEGLMIAGPQGVGKTTIAQAAGAAPGQRRRAS